MPGWILTILNILGVAETAAPLIERLLSDLGTYIASVFQELFGQSAAVKLEDAMQEAEYIVKSVADNLPGAVDFVKTLYGDIDGLLKAEPWVAQLLHASNQVMSAQHVNRGTANKLVEGAHAKVSMTK
jgi:hypothetical protein